MRFEDWLLRQPNLSADQERFLRMVGEQIKANAATMEGFQTYHLVNPPFSLSGGLDRAVRLFGGVEQRIEVGFDMPLKEAREEFERRYLEQKIREAGGNISKVAERVGVERTHLYRKFKSLNLDPKQVMSGE